MILQNPRIAKVRKLVEESYRDLILDKSLEDEIKYLIFDHYERKRGVVPHNSLLSQFYERLGLEEIFQTTMVTEDMIQEIKSFLIEYLIQEGQHERSN